MQPHTTPSQDTDDREPLEHIASSFVASGEPSVTRVPRPLSPLDGAPVDASAAPFSWHGVSGAAGYKLQIATDPGFDSDVITVDAGRTTSLTVYGMLPVREQPLFWRVRENSQPEVWSGYGRFVAASDDAVDAFRNEQESRAVEASREVQRQRQTREAELDLVPHYNRETSLTTASEASILLWMLASFAALIVLLLLVT